MIFNLIKLYTIISQFQYLFFIGIAIILTLSDLTFYNLETTQNEKNNIKSDLGKQNRNKDKNENEIILYIKKNNKYMHPEISGKYKLFTNELFNDSCVFKNIKNNIWIYKTYEHINKEKYYYWIITPMHPDEYLKCPINNRIIYYHSIVITHIMNNELVQYIDYGFFPEGVFYNYKNDKDSIEVYIIRPP